MDIKAKVDEVVAKVKDDPNFANDFQSNPVGAVEKVIGVDLPDDVINNVVETVKQKLSGEGNITDKIGGAIGGIGDAIGGLFGGKKD